MRIVSREEFMAMPAGTVYSHFCPAVFEGLCIKDTTSCLKDGTPIDWYHQELIGTIDANDSYEYAVTLERMEEDSQLDVGLKFDTIARDGLFNEEQLYAVYSQEDLLGLIQRLTLAYNQNTPDAVASGVSTL